MTVRRFRPVIFSLLFVTAAYIDAADNNTDAADNSTPEPLPVVKLSPQVRTDGARGQGYFLSLDCVAASKATANNNEEQRWLDLRRQQCAQQWKAFIR